MSVYFLQDWLLEVELHAMYVYPILSVCQYISLCDCFCGSLPTSSLRVLENNKFKHVAGFTTRCRLHVTWLLTGTSCCALWSTAPRSRATARCQRRDGVGDLGCNRMEKTAKDDKIMQDLHVVASMSTEDYLEHPSYVFSDSLHGKKVHSFGQAVTIWSGHIRNHGW